MGEIRMPIDTTKPSVSRIYDYVLGGQHNFEADRVAAQQILKVFPSYPTWARLNRWYLQMIAKRWAADGHRYILDLAAGMPTQRHFHTILTTAKVLYTDHDPMTVAYAGEVLGNNPAVSFIQADMREPPTILEAADRHFDRVRQVAIGCIGISYFLDDASLSQLMQALYAWAAPGSVLALSYIYGDQGSQRARDLLATYKRYSGAEVFLRDAPAIARLCAPWQLYESDTLANLLGVEDMIGEAEREGVGAEMFGAILEHGGSR